jgi:hypothetical protein
MAKLRTLATSLRVYNLHKQSCTRSLAKQCIKNGKDSQAVLFRSLGYRTLGYITLLLGLSEHIQMAALNRSLSYPKLAPRVASPRITFSRVHSDYPSDGDICLSTFYNTSKWPLNLVQDRLVRLEC